MTPSDQRRQTTERTAPRLYCITATRAPIVAVFRRGPSNWAQVGRWDLAAGRYEPGAWFGGRLFPRRSDLSPDGRYLCYFAHQPSASWEHGEAYVAVSKLPWLTALHAFGTCGTWTCGFHFTEEPAQADAAGEGASARLPIPWGLRSISAQQFATERRRGFSESPDSPPRDPTDAWDQQRNARLQKRQPGGARVLHVESLGWAGGEFGAAQAVDGLRVRYSLEVDDELTILDDLQWADWDAQGHLLVATRTGRIETRALSTRGVEVIFSADLSALDPDPQPAPEIARRW